MHGARLRVTSPDIWLYLQYISINTYRNAKLTLPGNNLKYFLKTADQDDCGWQLKDILMTCKDSNTKGMRILQIALHEHCFFVEPDKNLICHFRNGKQSFFLLITRSNVGRVASHSRLWDHYWGQNGGQLDDASPVTVPQATARCDSPQITSCF